MTFTHREWKRDKKLQDDGTPLNVKHRKPVAIVGLDPMLEDMLSEILEERPQKKKSGRRGAKEKW